MKSAIDLKCQSASNKIAILNPIYSALIDWSQNIIRAAERITIWICGLILLTNGWLIQNPNPLDLYTKIYFSVGSIIFGAIGVFIIIYLHRRFVDIISGIRRVNYVQRTYEENVFIKGDTLFPQHWDEQDARKGLISRILSFRDEPIFITSYVSLAITTLFAAAMIWSI